MTIDGTMNIATLGLRVTSIPGLDDLPANKNILKERDAAKAELQKRQEQTVTVIMIGKYTTTAALTSAVSTLTTLLKGATKHTFVDTAWGVNFTAVARSGFRTNVYGHNYRTIQIDLPLTITTL